MTAVRSVSNSERFTVHAKKLSSLLLAKLGITLALTFFLSTASAPSLAQSTIRTDNQKVLNFPLDRTYGTVYFLPRSQVLWSSDCGNILTRAIGKVVVPEDCFVWYKASSNFLLHPEKLSGLPDDAFDALTIRFVAMDAAEEHLIEKGLRYTNRFTTIKKLELSRSDINDAQLAAFERWGSLESLDIMGTKCDGSIFKTIGQSSRLKRLTLMQLSLDRKSLKYLKNFPNLRWLDISNTKILSSDVSKMVPLTQLESLQLSSNPGIDDSIFDFLLAFKHLKSLDVRSTSITFKGLDRLKGPRLSKLLAPSDLIHETTFRASFPNVKTKSTENR